MEQIAGFEHRRVERLAVEADQRTCAIERARHRLQHRPLVRKPRHHELPRQESVLVKPAAANQKNVRSGAAIESGRFEIEKHQRRPRRSTAGKERRISDRGFEPRGDFANPFSAVGRRRLPFTFHDKAATGPGACQGRKIR